MDPEIRNDFLRRAQISKFGFDLFANAQNAQEDHFISKNEDVFAFDWGILAQENPVWAYPPMEMLEKALTKLALNKALGVFCFLEASETPKVNVEG